MASGIKFYNIINWLLSQEIEIPQEFIDNKTKLNSIVPYLVEQLWLNPKLINYLNKHVNDLHRIPDPIEQLKLLKKLFKINHITKFDLYQFIPERAPDIIKEIEEMELYDENDARAKALMMKKLGIPFDKYIKPKPQKKNFKATEDDIKIAKTILAQEKMKESKKHSSNFLHNLTQEIIDEKGLILFDVSLLKKTNSVLFIFIDKENKKWYYKKSFAAKIYISKKDNVLNNDYIETITDDHFDQYIITDIKAYTRLKYMLNDSYRRIINGV